MKSLLRYAQGENAIKVFDALEVSVEQTAKNSLVESMRNSTLTLKKFGFAMKVRLNAATNFIHFLSATEDKAQDKKNWGKIAQALRGNLNEELGFTSEEEYKPEAAHNTWRQNYRSGLERVLLEQGILFQDIDDEETTAEVEESFGRKLKELANTEALPVLVGGFAILEGMLEVEFKAIRQYIQSRLQGLTPTESKYVMHHAGHEQRHVEEITIPLLQICSTSPHIVPEVIRGIQEMQVFRVHGVLEKIQNNLWKAEVKK